MILLHETGNKNILISMTEDNLFIKYLYGDPYQLNGG